MRKDMSQLITGTYRVGCADARAIVGARRKYRNRLDPMGKAGTCVVYVQPVTGLPMPVAGA